MAKRNGYSAKDITVLEGLEPVRKRPSMYIGGVGVRGLHHLLWEIVDNAIDEVMNGFATTVDVTLSADLRTVTVKDDGRGIPVDIHPKHKRPALELIMTTLHAGAKFDEGVYMHSGGLHGVGASVVNALSENMTIDVRRDGHSYSQSFARGMPTTKLKKLGPARGHGSQITFTPDPEIFDTTEFDPERIHQSLRDRAYLHRGIKIIWRNVAAGTRETIVQPDGIVSFCDRLAAEAGGDRVVPTTFFVSRDEGPRFECALSWTRQTNEHLLSFVNGIRTPQGGTHDAAVRTAVARAVRNYIDVHNLCPKSLKLTADDIREGLIGVVSVFIHEPRFQGQTKDRLHNPEIQGPIESVVRTTLESWLNEHRSLGDAIAERVLLAARARQASRQAARAVRRKSPTRKLTLPGKLADCSSTDPESCELFIVEGDSAGGTAKQGRDRKTQAILPLRGKVLNAEQASASKLRANKEIDHISKALGCGLGPHCDLSNLRYGKVVLLMDADSDGHHITTLLMTFFYRHMPELVRAGRLFIAQPPLFRIVHGKKRMWAADDGERDRLLKKLPANARPQIQRFKGLGEMSSKALAETTLDPKTRRLLLVQEQNADAAHAMLRALMGKDTEPRYDLIMAEAQLISDLDV